MKTHLAFVVLLAGCHPSNPTDKPGITPGITYYTPLQRAVIEAEKPYGLDSVYSLRFSKPTPFTRRDSINGRMHSMDPTIAYIAEQKKSLTKALAAGTKSRVASNELRELQRFVQLSSANMAKYKQDLQRAQQHLPNQIVGQQLLHTYRINGRLDSIQLVVFNTGEVGMFEHVKHVEGKPNSSFTLLRDYPPLGTKNSL